MTNISGSRANLHALRSFVSTLSSCIAQHVDMPISHSRQWIRRGMDKALRLIMPERCVFCGVGVCDEAWCHRCSRLLHSAENPCTRCAAPLAAQQSAGIECGRCQAEPPSFDKAVSALSYRFPVDAALKALKFDGQLYVVPACASLIYPLLARHFPAADALVPVPLHWLRHARRGFNQAAEICKPVAKNSGLPMIRSIRRTRSTPSQSGLNAAARRRNLSDAFAVRGKLKCRHPVIVDDVMTTGETCHQLGRVLREAGAESVGVLVVARA
jgi:ComF family protein